MKPRYSEQFERSAVKVLRGNGWNRSQRKDCRTGEETIGEQSFLLPIRQSGGTDELRPTKDLSAPFVADRKQFVARSCHDHVKRPREQDQILLERRRDEILGHIRIQVYHAKRSNLPEYLVLQPLRQPRDVFFEAATGLDEIRISAHMQSAVQYLEVQAPETGKVSRLIAVFDRTSSFVPLGRTGKVHSVFHYHEDAPFVFPL
jgi:hypothetical protein